MSIHPVGWFEISVQELVRARAFSEAVFEVKLVRPVLADLGGWAAEQG